MHSLIKNVIGRITGKSSKNTHPVPHIDGAENLLIDSSVLCCPVCYNVYSIVPLILSCGHTFCATCVRTIARGALPCSSSSDVFFKCPLCREDAAIGTVVKNYLVEDLLKSVEEFCPSVQWTPAELTKIANLRITKERYVQRCNDLEQLNNRLHNELEERKKHERKNYACIAILFLIYLILTALFG